MSCWEQALWMGDVVADKDYALTITDGVDVEVVNIPKGAWWANAIVFWEWAQSEAGLDFSVDLSFDGTTQTLSFVVTGTAAASFDVDGDMVGEVLATGTSLLGTWQVSRGVFLPSFPVMQYDVGGLTHGGTSERTMTGRAATVRGIDQPLRSIQMQFAPGERDTWRALWASHFSRGRSCTFWHGDLPELPFLFLTQLGACDQLVVEPNITQWRGQRTVEYRNVAIHDEGAIEYRRRPNIPLSEPDLQSFYIPPSTAW